MGSKDPSYERDPITVQQGKILNDRESLYQSITQPALLDFFNEAKNFEFNRDFQTASVGQLAQGGINQANQAFEGQQDQLQLSLAKRGVQDSGVGMASLNMLGNANAQQKAGIVNQAVNQTTAAANQAVDRNNAFDAQKMNMIQQGLGGLLGQAPQATGGMPAGTPQAEGTDWMQALSGAVGGVLGGLGGSGPESAPSSNFGGSRTYTGHAPLANQPAYVPPATGSSWNTAGGYNPSWG